MDINDMILVSVDDHVVEPPHLFEGRLAARNADLAPRFVTREDGSNALGLRGPGDPERGPERRRGAAAGGVRHGADVLRRAARRVLRHRRAGQGHGRQRGVGSLCFPSFPQFCGQLFARTEDKDVALAMVRAYNDWHIEEWCGTHPGRFIPCSLPAIWDPQVLADEVRRTARMGAHAVTFSENPSKLGWPSFHTTSGTRSGRRAARSRSSSACTSARPRS